MLYIFRPLRTRHEDLVCTDGPLMGSVNAQAVAAALKMIDLRRGHVAELATAGLHHVESQLVRGGRRVPEHETLLLTTWMIAAEADVKTIMAYMPYLVALYHLARARKRPDLSTTTFSWAGGIGENSKGHVSKRLANELAFTMWTLAYSMANHGASLATQSVHHPQATARASETLQMAASILAYVVDRVLPECDGAVTPTSAPATAKGKARAAAAMPELTAEAVSGIRLLFIAEAQHVETYGRARDGKTAPAFVAALYFSAFMQYDYAESTLKRVPGVYEKVILGTLRVFVQSMAQMCLAMTYAHVGRDVMLTDRRAGMQLFREAHETARVPFRALRARVVKGRRKQCDLNVIRLYKYVSAEFITIRRLVEANAGSSSELAISRARPGELDRFLPEPVDVTTARRFEPPRPAFTVASETDDVAYATLGDEIPEVPPLRPAP